MSCDPSSLDIETLPWVFLTCRKDLPRAAGVYIVRDGEGKVLYIGHSININRRWTSHHHILKRLSADDYMHIAWYLLEDFSVARALEQALIAQQKPLYNRDISTKKTLKDTNQKRPPKMPGPARHSYNRIDVHFHADHDDYAWFKEQPEGFAGLMRRLMKEYRQRVEQPC